MKKFFVIDADFWRRFRLYALGLVLGFILVNVITKGKACQTPGSLKIEELYSQPIGYSSVIQCQLQQLKLSNELLKSTIKSGKVNYGLSEVHAKPYGKYLVESEFDNHPIQLTIIDKGDSSILFRLKGDYFHLDDMCK